MQKNIREKEKKHAQQRSALDVIIETPSKARIFLINFLVCSEVK
jgi:hypothetical protein